jgi:hypothetical protein
MVPPETPPQPRTAVIQFTATVGFADMTWGDLRRFVELAGQHGVTDEETVELSYENDDFYSPLGLEIAPLSAHYYKDDAIAEVGWKAELLYVRGLAFCADVLSDGFISDVQLARFVSVGISGYSSLAKELDRVGLWVRDDDERGYWVARWEKWNLTRTEIEDRLRRDADRKGEQ